MDRRLSPLDAREIATWPANINPSKLRPDGKAKGNLLSDVKAFEKASLASEYYEGFNVNSKNCMETSTGTTVWIAECRRLLDRCVAQEKKGDPAEVRQYTRRLTGLLEHHYNYGSKKMLAVARKAATPAQRKAVPKS